MDQYVNCISNIQRNIKIPTDNIDLNNKNNISVSKVKKKTTLAAVSPTLLPTVHPPVQQENISLKSADSDFNICQSFGLNEQNDNTSCRGILDSINSKVILSNYEKSILKKNKYIQEQVEFKQYKSRDNEEY